MVQDITTKRQCARAQLKSLLLVSLLASGASAQLPTLSTLPDARVPAPVALPAAPPSLAYVPACNSNSSSACKTTTTQESGSPQSRGRATGLLGLNRRPAPLPSAAPDSSAPASGAPTSVIVPAQFATLPEIPEQARKTKLGQPTQPTRNAKEPAQRPATVTHAFLPETSNGSIVTGPVPALPLGQAGSLLDIDLPGGNPNRTAVAPATRGPSSKALQFSLRDDEPLELDAPKPTQPSLPAVQFGLIETATPLRPVIEKARPTSVEVHEGFAPRKSLTLDSFQMSDNEKVAQTAKLTAAQPSLPTASPIKPLLPTDSSNASFKPVAPTDEQSVKAIQTASSVGGEQKQPPLALLAPPTLVSQSDASLRTDALSLATSSLSTLPTQSPGATVSMPAGAAPTPSIAASSQRPLSLKIGAGSTGAPLTPARPADKRQTSQENPIALSEPIVKAVKQASVSLPVDSHAKPEPVAAQTEQALETKTEADAPSPYRELIVQMHQEIKAKYPGSRVEVKTDEEGLIVHGVAASEAEAGKILAYIRKSSLCPVTDRVTTQR